MKAEIINVGTEILLGGIVNLNSRYLSEELASLGIGVYYQTSVGDNPVRLKKVLSSAVSRSEIIILTGGLGPTADDITKETVAAALNIPLVEDAVSLDRIEKYFAAAGKPMPEANRKQALCPRGSVIFKNDVGTAPGYALSAGRQHIIMLPGPPAELSAMFDGYVKDYLKKLSPGVILSHNVRVFGMGESEVAEKVTDLLHMENPTVAPYAKDGEVELRVTAKAETPMAAHKMCFEVIKDIEARLGENVYTTKYKNLQETVVELLKSKGFGISTAESCTAGLLSSRITEIPGASQVFNFGLTAYANEIKHEFLGVKTETLEQYGAVSKQTAVEMAIGAREHGMTKLGVGITGVAGPGGSEAKPVGLVYVALCDEKNYWCKELHLTHKANDRDAIRNISAMTALDMARRYLQKYPKLPDGMEPIPEEKTETAEEAANPVAPLIDKLSYANILNDDVFNSVHITDEEYVTDENSKLDLPEYSNGAFDFVNGMNEEDMNAAELGKTSKVTGGLFSRLFKHKNSAETAEEILIDQESPSEETVLDDVKYEPIDESVNETADLPSETADDGDGDTDDSVQLTEEDEDEYMAKEKNIFKRIAKSIIPWKGDKVGEVIRKLVFIIALAVFVGAAVYLVSFFTDQNRNSALIDNVRNQWENVRNDETVNDEGIYSRFEFLLEQNPDTIGWIKINNTNIDNPVYYHEDITYYETHNMAGEKSRYGALFVDPACTITPERVNQNITIYGHNTQDGSMFADLLRFRSLSYYRQHPTIEFDTIYRKGEYKIFAVMVTNAFAEQDDGYVYPYMQESFYSYAAFMEWVEQAKQRSIINTGVDVLPEDEIITLSTCAYYFKEARMVVMARRVRDGEAVTDVSKAQYNKTPLYPQAWYDKNGGEKPVFTSTSSTPSTDSTSSDTTTTSSTPASSSEASTTTSRPATSTSKPAASATPSTPSETPDTSSETSSTPSTTPGTSSETPSQPEESTPSEPDTSSQPDGTGEEEDNSGGEVTSTPEGEPEV